MMTLLTAKISRFWCGGVRRWLTAAAVDSVSSGRHDKGMLQQKLTALAAVAVTKACGGGSGRRRQRSP